MDRISIEVYPGCGAQVGPSGRYLLWSPGDCEDIGALLKVERIIGATRYAREDANELLITIAYHEDQVVIAPPATTLLMNSADCPITSLRYQTAPCWTIQSHPEFTPPFARELFEHTRCRPLTDDICDAAIASIDDFSPDLDSIHQEIRRTFQH